jgi:DNA-binding NarL/FixJ family response regulator
MTLAIGIVEDDRVMLESYRQAIETQPDFEIIFALDRFETGKQALAQRIPDVLLIDLGLPDGSGADLIRMAREKSDDVEIMVVTVFGDDDHVVTAIEAGATGYLLKESEPIHVVHQIRKLVTGASPINPSIARRILFKLTKKPSTAAPVNPATIIPGISTEDAAAAATAHQVPPVSPREHEILELIARGLSITEIGKKLEVSSHTVTTHVKNIYKKLSVHSRTEAVYEARQLGILR